MSISNLLLNFNILRSTWRDIWALGIFLARLLVHNIFSMKLATKLLVKLLHAFSHLTIIHFDFSGSMGKGFTLAVRVHLMGLRVYKSKGFLLIFVSESNLIYVFHFSLYVVILFLKIWQKCLPVNIKGTIFFREGIREEFHCSWCLFALNFFLGLVRLIRLDRW